MPNSIDRATILALNNSFYHWGAIVLPRTSGTRVGPPDAETLAVAHAQGRRLARVAHVIGVTQEQGLLDAVHRGARASIAGMEALTR